MSCEYCGGTDIDLSDIDSDSLVDELASRRAGSDYYIAESIDEKMKMELFIEYVDKIPFTNMKQLFESFKK